MHHFIQAAIFDRRRGFAEERLKAAADRTGSPAKLGRILHPSPASPAANRGWAEAATKQLVAQGVWV